MFVREFELYRRRNRLNYVRQHQAFDEYTRLTAAEYNKSDHLAILFYDKYQSAVKIKNRRAIVHFFSRNEYYNTIWLLLIISNSCINERVWITASRSFARYRTSEPASFDLLLPNLLFKWFKSIQKRIEHLLDLNEFEKSIDDHAKWVSRELL